MKKYLFVLMAIGFFACGEDKTENKEKRKDLLPTSMVNNPNSANGVDSAAAAELPTMDFKDTIYNFGVIKAGENVMHEFEFTNNGKTPLIISSTHVGCGCTVPDYPHEPIAPGKSQTIKVMFNSEGKSGMQDKEVMINTNTLRGTHYVHIKADVR